MKRGCSACILLIAISNIFWFSSLFNRYDKNWLFKRSLFHRFHSPKQLIQTVDTSVAVKSHAIIVPYRNRTYHLTMFKEIVGPHLKRNFPNDAFSLWIVEQANGELFNRAWLGNVGLSEISKFDPLVECVVHHDVDLVPRSDGIPYNKCVIPTQLGSELSHRKNSVPFKQSAGGVVSINMRDWKKINGFSNDYEGWGGEDDDLFSRLKANKLLDRKTKTIHRPPKGNGTFEAIDRSPEHHPQLKGDKEYNHSLKILGQMRSGSDRWKTDGLSDLHYEVVDVADDITILGFQSVHHLKVVP